LPRLLKASSSSVDAGSNAAATASWMSRDASQAEVVHCSRGAAVGVAAVGVAAAGVEAAAAGVAVGAAVGATAGVATGVVGAAAGVVGTAVTAGETLGSAATCATTPGVSAVDSGTCVMLPRLLLTNGRLHCTLAELTMALVTMDVGGASAAASRALSSSVSRCSR